MAPAASIHSAAAAAAGASKRPADSDAELPLDSSALHQQVSSCAIDLDPAEDGTHGSSASANLQRSE
jgi:hypothetical protein